LRLDLILEAENDSTNRSTLSKQADVVIVAISARLLTLKAARKPEEARTHDKRHTHTGTAPRDGRLLARR
jgi:hypothetical protein